MNEFVKALVIAGGSSIGPGDHVTSSPLSNWSKLRQFLWRFLIQHVVRFDVTAFITVPGDLH